MSENMEIVSLKEVWKVYPPNTQALRGVSISVKKGDYIAIIGRSGSGKSTLLHIMGLVDKPTKGKVYFLGKDISRLDEKEITDLRAKYTGFLFQAFNLLPELNAVENVALQGLIVGMDYDSAVEKAKKLLEALGMESKFYSDVTKLSGGEKQRVGLARALIIDPLLILADEPTGDLDTKTRDEVMNILDDINKKGHTLVIVTHDLEVAKHARKVIRLTDGKIAKQ
ncbi:MAG: ABC transporter ATP-binding protein [Candidatus Micrarchaeia archaeon]